MSRLEGLRVALVGPLPPPMGGMATQTMQLAELLGSAQARVEVVRTNTDYRPRWIGRVRGVRAAFRLFPYLRTLWCVAGHSDVVHVMANSGWSWHLFAAPAVWIGWLRRVPVIVNYRGGEAESFLECSARSVRWTMRRVARIIVPSGFLQQVFSRYGMRADVVPNIVDLRRFQPDKREAEEPPQLLVARNLEPVYDIETALRAFVLVRRRWPSARMTIAGSGPDEGRLRALTRSLEIDNHVEFSGTVGRDAMAALLKRTTVALNPSRADNMPNSVLEALASGTPVVSTRVGGVPFIVRDGVTGLLVPPGDSQAMADAVTRLIEQPALRAALALAGLDEARRYAWDRVQPMLEEIYRSSAPMRRV